MPDRIRPAHRVLFLRCADTVDQDISRYGSMAHEKMEEKNGLSGMPDICRVDVVGGLFICGGAFVHLHAKFSMEGTVCICVCLLLRSTTANWACV